MPRRILHAALPVAAIIAAVLLLPLASALLTGRLPPSLFKFPPPTAVPTDFPGCSWLGRIALPVAMAGFAVWLTVAWRNRPPSRQPETRERSRPFPVWGWVAVAWTITWWMLAWTRFPWFAGAQLYTFFPLWMGFIVTVNALTWSRHGSCTMLSAPGMWLFLHLVSAAFWWGFEWLNRFVQNWHYIRAESFDAVIYALHGTICFSTVVPAVLAVRECMATCVDWTTWCTRGPRWRWLARRRSGAALILIGIAGLALTGARPQEAYPALWSAPLLLAVGLQVITGRPGWWSDLVHGDWHVAASWAAAALICGLFWELWNELSLAKWIYTVPYLDCWHIFEMPLPGYLGYPPFGLECALVVHWINRSRGELA